MSDRICSTLGCERPQQARGRCNTCYSRLRRKGLLPRKTVEDYFWAKVDRSASCWVWTGACTGDGYGVIRVDYVPLRVHRVAYELLVGAIPDGLQIDHKCWNARCVNPAHLEPQPLQKNTENRRGANANSSTGVRGVSRENGRFKVKVTKDGHQHYGGHFSTLEQAEAEAKNLRNRLMTNNLADRRDV